MNKLIDGIHRFQSVLAHERPWDPAATKRGQSPEALMLTCSDARVVPHMFTGTGVGDIFMLRNAGNLVPEPGVGSSEEASIAFAIEQLRVPHLIVCGHAHCGAMSALATIADTPSRSPVASWLRNARALLGTGSAPGDLVEANVVHQLDRLEALPAVQRALEWGEVETHGWVYDVVHGRLSVYDRTRGAFVPFVRRGVGVADVAR